MSELTPTNEEHLAELVRGLKSYDKVRLMPSGKQGLPMIEVFVVPVDLEFDHLPEEERLKYWRAAFMAVELHGDVWQATVDAARKYR